MAIITKPYGDFTNNVDVVDAVKINAIINLLYQTINGNLDPTNVPGMGDLATLQTAAKNTLVAALNEINTKYPYNAMTRQAIINGNFDVWQRGTSFTNPASGTYMADRFKNGYNADGGTLPTLIYSLQNLTSGDIPNSYNFYRINTNGSGTSFGPNSFYRLQHLIENGTRYLAGAGKKVTLSFLARSSIAGKRLGVEIEQIYGSGGSPSSSEILQGSNITLTTTWTKYTVTFTTNTLVGKTFGTNNDDMLVPAFWMEWGANLQSRMGATSVETFGGAGNIDIAQLQLCAGDTSLPFQPKDIDDETKKALRFTWIPQGNSVSVRATSYTANTITFDVSLSVQLRTTPTIRGAANTDIVVNTIAAAAQTGFTFAAVPTSNGARITATKTAHGLTDAYLEIKTTSGLDAEL